ncbi:MAG: T9SS type A sorting domain-containing protein [Bacteroidetes bacterium]|nr:T9SS type A sorting domain-containing protein [Bacteroidota bacterium]
MRYSLLLLIIFQLSTWVFAQPDLSIKLNPNFGKDARIDSRISHANLNYGNSTTLGIWTWNISGGLSINRTLLSFPISQIPSDALIQTATLRLFYDSTSVFTMGQSGLNNFVIRRITGNWHEDSVTWNNQPAVTNLNQVSSILGISPSNPNIQINVTNLLNAARDSFYNSLDLRLQLTTEQTFRSIILTSSEHPDTALRPILDIKYGTPQIFLIRPNLLDSHEMNKPLTIEWNTIGVNNVSIDYSLQDTQWINFASNIPSKNVNNSFIWTPNFTAPQCKIRVRSSTNSSINDISDKWFKIIDGPSITYQSPASRSILNAGGSQIINWLSDKIALVNLSYSTNNKDFFLIDSNIVASLGSYTWQVPMIKSDSVFIRISSKEFPWVFAQNNLPVSILPLPWFKFKKPSEVQNWEAGSTQELSWAFNNSNYSRLYFAQELGPWAILKDSILVDSSYSWTIPLNLSGKIKLRVADPAQRVFGDSTPFFIEILAPILKDTPSLDLLYPIGGEVFEAGSEINIQWKSKELDSVRIQIKSNNQDWVNISMPLSAKENSFLYKLPDINETINFIKIIGSNATTELIDSNTNPFEIKKKETGLYDVLPREWQVYPNPVTGNSLTVSINLIGSEEVVLKVYSPIGELLLSKPILTAQTTLPVEQLPSGVYLLSVEVGNENKQMRRIIVQRQ